MLSQLPSHCHQLEVLIVKLVDQSRNQGFCDWTFSYDHSCLYCLDDIGTRFFKFFLSNINYQGRWIRYMDFNSSIGDIPNTVSSVYGLQ